jgi:hypothetical protein
LASDRIDDPGDDEGLRAARNRVAALFDQLNSLTPDELGRIGLLRPAAERETLIAAVDAAAAATGRAQLVAEARHEAGDIVLRRYADSTFRPTWIALNWSLSGGTVEDRVAVAQAVADAAAVAAVADVLDAEVADALAADARHVVGLAGGSASDGALVRGLRPAADPTMRRSPRGQRVLLAGAAITVALTVIGGLALDLAMGLAGWFGLTAGVLLIYWLLARSVGRL